MEAEMNTTDNRFEDDAEEFDDVSFKHYDIVASPNDFNIKTIVDFIDSGSVVIPGFQRHYVWDRRRASKLIESLLIGLPVPQVFLYEQDRNKFLVIDGQQRLMSIYYFVKQRFPRKEKRADLRIIFSEHSKIPTEIFHDDTYFTNFKLTLSREVPDQRSRFEGLKYETLGEHKTTFDLRTIRNVIIKQTAPQEDRDSSIFEIFNRLNTGGVNLAAQEIRASLYHSDFMSMLNLMNLNERWRTLLGFAEPDYRAKDVETLLRGIAMLVEGRNYKEPMTKFLNTFSRQAKSYTSKEIKYLIRLIESFFDVTAELPEDIFRTRSRRFNISVFDAVFHAVCLNAYDAKEVLFDKISADRIYKLENDKAFVDATKAGTARTENVQTRLRRAREILGG